MDFKLVETFLVLSDTLNLTKTAKILFVSQSTVSNRLENIENEIGVKLIDRDRGLKKIELTVEGKEFLNIALEYENINEKIRDFSSKSFKQTVSIGTLNSINNFLFNNLYKKMLDNSNIQLKIKTEHTGEIYNQVVSRIIDVGFVTQYIAFPQIEYSKLAEESMVLVTKKINHSKFMNPKDLDPEKQIYFNWGTNMCIGTISSSLIKRNLR